MSPTSESAFHAQLNAIRRRWPVGLITAATVVAMAAPIAMGLPNLYRAGATLKVDQPPDPLNLTTNPLLEVNARLETIRQEVLSRQRVVTLAEELNVYPELRQAGQIDAVVATMQRDVKVDQLSTSRGDGRVTTVSFRVSYTGNDPAKVAAVANRLAAYYVERSGAIRSRQASRTTDSLRSELAETARRLEAQDKRVMDYTRENVGSLPAQMSSVATKISQLTTQLQANTVEVTRLTDQYEGAQRQVATLLAPSGGADQSDPTIRLAQAQRELENLLISFKEPSIQVRTKRSEIAALEKQVASRTPSAGTNPASSPLTTLREQMAGWQTRLESLKKTNDELQRDLARNEAILAGAPIRSAEFDKLTGEAQQTRTLYNSLSTRFQEALAGERAQTGQSGQDFEILDPAVPADSPSAPDRQLLLGVTGVLALVLGIVLMLVLDYFDRSFRSVDELRAFTHVPVLATIPRVVTRKARTRQIIVGVLAGAAVSVALGFVSVGMFQLAKHAEPLTRLLIR